MGAMLLTVLLTNFSHWWSGWLWFPWLAFNASLSLWQESVSGELGGALIHLFAARQFQFARMRSIWL